MLSALLEQIHKGKLWDFHGGIHPDEHKDLSSHQPLVQLGLPPLLVLPLKQHIGSSAELSVRVGDRVLTGQPLTRPESPMQVPIHASTSGVVTAIAPHTVAHPSGLSEPCIHIKPDGLDEWRPREPIADYTQWQPEALLQRIHEAGIAGLGGAGFPTDVKLKGALGRVELLIINGCECEPYITADDRLMQEHAAEIMDGIQILQHIVKPTLTLIALEDNKPEAIAALMSQVRESHTQIKVVPTKYPSGGERQLIEILTGLQVPSGGLPQDLGILMQNVGTCYAIRQAVIEDEPLIRRVVTLTGERFSQPGNAWVRLGTSVRWLLSQFHLKPEKRQRIIMGGPMMGFTLPHADVPVVKTTNCLLAPSQQELPSRDLERNCIRCGECAGACPASLLPQQLYWYSKAQDHEAAEKYRLFDCIECGACAWVCPSNIPLVQYYRQEKSEIRAQKAEARQAERARERFEAKKQRLEAERQSRELRHQQASAERRQQLAATGGEDPIAAALARVKARQQALATGQEAEQSAQQSAREARKAQARQYQEQKKAAGEAPLPAAGKPESLRLDAVAAAVARAKARKAEQAQAAAADAGTPPASPEDPRQAAVAAAVARAKARKAEQAQAAAADAGTPPVTPEDPRQAAVAAAVARAKARKAEQAQAAATDAGTPPASPEDPRQAAVAAAVARAKARKAEQAQAAATDAGTPPTSPEDPRQAAVAAAVARAKARKAAQAAAATPGTDSSSHDRDRND